LIVVAISSPEILITFSGHPPFVGGSGIVGHLSSLSGIPSPSESKEHPDSSTRISSGVPRHLSH